MGITILVIGVAFVIASFYFLLMPVTAETEEESDIMLVLRLLFFMGLITVGALLARKYVEDRKKEKNS